MRLLITGGRDFEDEGLMYPILDQLWDNYSVLLHGGASGADNLAFRFFNDRHLQTEIYEADWEKYGRAAGPIRNQEMVDAKPDLCISFPGGGGTADCTMRCRTAGIPIVYAR